MPSLQELSVQQINEALRMGAERQVPAAVTVRCGQTWQRLHSRLVALEGEHLLIAGPSSAEGATPHFEMADKVGLSFKLKHHKHIFTATVAGEELWDGGTEGEDRLVRLCWPVRMHRLQRRAFLRAEVPANRIVRASFWLGGCAAEPAGTSEDAPVWSGVVNNVSAGGFQMAVDPAAADVLEVGDTVGVRLKFGAGRDTVYADAQFRHLLTEDGQVLMGFQFLGLAHTSRGRHALQVITTKVADFHRQSRPNRSRRHGS